MRYVPVVSRGWCDLDGCSNAANPQDCVRLNGLTVCTSCLIDWGGGVEREEYDKLEIANDRLDNEIDALRGELHVLRQQIGGTKNA